MAKTIVSRISDIYESFETVERMLSDAREDLNEIAAQFGYVRSTPPMPESKIAAVGIGTGITGFTYATHSPADVDQ